MTCCGNERNFCVRQGATFNPIIRWGAATLSVAPITNVSNSAPVQITAPNHGIPNGWPVAVTGVQNMVDLNATRYPPVEPDYHPATVVDANTIQLNEVSTASSLAYAGGGDVVWNTPQDLTGVTATMTFWASQDRVGAPLVVLSNQLGGTGMTVDTVGKAILPFLQTAGLQWGVEMAYYDLTVTDASGVVTELFTGTFTLE